MEKDLKALSYSLSAANFCTSDFGPCQSRHRAWIVAGLHCDTEKAIEDAMAFKCCPLRMLGCLVPKELGREVPKESKSKATHRGIKWKATFEEKCKELGKARSWKMLLFFICLVWALRMFFCLGHFHLEPSWCLNAIGTPNAFRKAAIIKLRTRLRPMVPHCSERELAILAVSIRELETFGIDCFEQVMVLQVVSWPGLTRNFGQFWFKHDPPGPGTAHSRPWVGESCCHPAWGSKLWPTVLCSPQLFPLLLHHSQGEICCDWERAVSPPHRWGHGDVWKMVYCSYHLFLSFGIQKLFKTPF